MLNESFRIKVLLRSEQSNCQVAVIENTVLAGWDGPPLAAAECLHFYEGFCTGWFRRPRCRAQGRRYHRHTIRRETGQADS